MTKLFLPVILGCIFASPSALHAQTLFEDKEEETLKVSFDKSTEATVVEHNDVRYEVIRYVVGLAGDKKDVIAKAQIKNSVNYNREGSVSNLKVDLYYFDSSKQNSIKTADKTYEIPNASEVKFQNDVWEAITYGCCGAETYQRLYSYASDKPILRFNERFWKIVLPNHDSARRYVGVLVKAETVPNAMEAAFGAKPDADLSITYSSLSGKEQRAYFKLKTNKGVNTGDLRIESIHKEDSIEESDNSINVWSADKKAAEGDKEKSDASQFISGLTIKADIFINDGDKQTIKIPIENDKLGKPEFNDTVLQYLEN